MDEEKENQTPPGNSSSHKEEPVPENGEEEEIVVTPLTPPPPNVKFLDEEREFREGKDEGEEEEGEEVQLYPIEDIKTLQKENEELKKEYENLKEKYLRALADLDNARKRFQRDALEIRKYGHEVAVREILPVLDTPIRGRCLPLSSVEGRADDGHLPVLSNPETIRGRTYKGRRIPF